MPPAPAPKRRTARSPLLANMSHELRTPLNAIIGFRKSCRRKSWQACHSDLQGICPRHQSLGPASAWPHQRCAGSFAHRAGRFQITEGSRSHSLRKTAADRGNPRAGAARRYRCRVRRESPIVYGDARALQTWINLLTNAVKFSPPDECAPLCADGRKWRDAPAFDNGPGIADRNREGAAGLHAGRFWPAQPGRARAWPLS